MGGLAGSLLLLCLAVQTPESRAESTKYIELDHNLVAGRLSNINKDFELPGRVEEETTNENSWRTRFLLNKYNVSKQNVMKILHSFDKDFEPVLGNSTSASGRVFFDHDFGFFSAILACYNNHWVLRTSPDDWWNVIVRNVAQAVDDNGKKEAVRDFFVTHQGKKEIVIDVGPSLSNIVGSESWLFKQFTKGIKENIKTPGYADAMQADFSTTTPEQLISSQVMLMASLQEYFDYTASTACGIPGVEMVGTEQDWQRLVEKTQRLRDLLEPVMEEVGLADWFTKSLATLEKLLDTQQGKPDTKWWSHVLSWNEIYGSGGRSWWDGWIIDFLMAARYAERPDQFQSGVVSVPLKLTDGPVVDTGRLVAGTIGFTVNPQGKGKRPTVQACQGWALLLPRGSPITPLLRGDKYW